MLRCCRWVAVVSIVLSASVSFGQRPGGGTPGGRPGGFGGGFGGPGGGMSSPLMLAANEAVQKELNLSDEQVGDIKSLGEQVREEMRSAFSGGFGGQDQSEEERAKQREKLTESMKKVNEKFQPKLNEALKPEQRDRLKQIQVQAAGSQAYQLAEVVAALKISKEQQDKLAAISKEFGEKQRDLFPRGGQGGGERLNFEEMRKKGEELTAARDKQIAEVLTAEQKSDLEKLKGKTFDVAQLRPAFGGGRGGPGAGAPGAGGANPAGRPQRRPQEGDKKADEKKSDK